MVDSQSLFCFYMYVLSAKTQNLKKVCTGLFPILNQLYATGSSHSELFCQLRNTQLLRIS